MMHIEATDTFIRCYQRLPLEIQRKIDKALRLFSDNPRHPSLHNKRMSGVNNIYELRVDRSYRMTYSIINSTAILRKVGKHDILLRP